MVRRRARIGPCAAAGARLPGVRGRDCGLLFQPGRELAHRGLAGLGLAAPNRELELLAAADRQQHQAVQTQGVDPVPAVGAAGAGLDLETGKDADLLILNRDLTIDSVLAKGRLMVGRGKITVKGTFEE